MTELLLLVVSCVIGLAIWTALMRMTETYKSRACPRTQTRLYEFTKNIPKHIVDVSFSFGLWASIGSCAIYLGLALLGFDSYLPRFAWSRPVVGIVLALALLVYWSTPERSEPTIPRGRDLKPAADSDHVKASRKLPLSRGRTIRSYRDIK